jgi:hypothetical protein
MRDGQFNQEPLNHISKAQLHRKLHWSCDTLKQYNPGSIDNGDSSCEHEGVLLKAKLAPEFYTTQSAHICSINSHSGGQKQPQSTLTSALSSVRLSGSPLTIELIVFVADELDRRLGAVRPAGERGRAKELQARGRAGEHTLGKHRGFGRSVEWSGRNLGCEQVV